MDCPTLPPEFLDRLRAIVGDQQYTNIADSFSKTKKTSFRVNPIKATVDQVLGQLQAAGVNVTPVSWCEHAFQVDAEQRELVTHSALASEGLIYVQGLSSILAPLFLEPQPEQWNLDLAAAPGGKASHMAALMDNSGKLSVVEPIKKRMYRLADNLKRLGVTISKTYLMDGRKVGQKVPDRFDCVLLDAPCSGEAMMDAFRPDSYSRWSQRKIREQSRKQAGLIVSAFTSLKPGGTLLYSTCSFAPEENEAIVSHLLERADGAARLEPIEMPFENWQPGMSEFQGAVFPESIELARRILPNESFDGFFMAKIVKEEF